MRVDVLIWDTHDSRHRTTGRDDIENLKRMYYHVLKNVLINKWPSNSIWEFFPDENTAFKWDSIQKCLQVKISNIINKQENEYLFSFSEEFMREFKIFRIKEIDSKLEPICQVADLFAGLGAFSYKEYQKYTNWLNKRNGQLSLGFEDCDLPKYSKGEEEKFVVMEHLDKIGKKRKLHISLKTNRGFKTFNKRNPINFWLYTPQNILDKAPKLH